MNTPNKITVSRILLVPVFIVLMLWKFPGHILASLIIFAIAGASDSVDGYIARKYNQITDFGKFADPLADKILIMSALLIFVQWGQVPAWCAIVILAREFAVTGLRLVAVEAGRVIPAGISGKLKTFTSTVGCCVMLTPWHSVSIGTTGVTVDAVCVFLMVVLTVWSGVMYFYRNASVLKNLR